MRRSTQPIEWIFHMRRPFCEGVANSSITPLVNRTLQRLCTNTQCEAQAPNGLNCLYYGSWILIRVLDGLRRMAISTYPSWRAKSCVFLAKNACRLILVSELYEAGAMIVALWLSLPMRRNAGCRGQSTHVCGYRYAKYPSVCRSTIAAMRIDEV